MATFATLNKTITTAGTRVQVSSTSLLVKKIIVAGHAANTGHIYLGDVGVSSSVGLQLKVGAAPVVIGDIEIAGKDDSFDLINMYVDASVNGEKVSILYFL
jgi:hypothetical protein